ncbi:MAG: hypothetical protein RLZZ76_388 [Candidatus Parcubacteria bacterium]|jgi:hypothetical protein
MLGVVIYNYTKRAVPYSWERKMDNALLKTPFAQLLLEALANKPSGDEPDTDESWRKEYDHEAICTLPESLRSLQELQGKLCRLGSELEERCAKLAIDSIEYQTTCVDVAILAKQTELIADIIFTTLVQTNPRLHNLDGFSYSKNWEVLKLTKKKKQKFSKQKEIQYLQ